MVDLHIVLVPLLLWDQQTPVLRRTAIARSVKGVRIRGFCGSDCPELDELPSAGIYYCYYLLPFVTFVCV